MPDRVAHPAGDPAGAGPARGVGNEDEDEDAKLLVLARSVAARGGGDGAAVRDAIGRTYVAGPVTLRSLSLSALQAAVAAAVASGAGAVEAVALVGSDPTSADADLLAELGSPTVRRG